MKLLVSCLSGLRKTEFCYVCLALGWRFELFLRNLSIGRMENGTNFQYFSSFFLIVDWAVPWAVSVAPVSISVLTLIVWSSTVRIGSSTKRVGSRRRISISVWRFSHDPFGSVVLISHLEVFTCWHHSPDPWLVPRRLFYFCINVTLLSDSLVFDSFNFFISYLFATPVWSVTIRAAAVAKFCSLLSSLLYGSTGREFLSATLTRFSCISDLRLFVSCPSVTIWALLCFSSLKKLEETWKIMPLCFFRVEVNPRNVRIFHQVFFCFSF